MEWVGVGSGGVSTRCAFPVISRKKSSRVRCVFWVKLKKIWESTLEYQKEPQATRKTDRRVSNRDYWNTFFGPPFFIPLLGPQAFCHLVLEKYTCHLVVFFCISSWPKCVVYLELWLTYLATILPMLNRVFLWKTSLGAPHGIRWTTTGIKSGGMCSEHWRISGFCIFLVSWIQKFFRKTGVFGWYSCSNWDWWFLTQMDQN